MVKGVKKLMAHVFGRKKDVAPPKNERDGDGMASSPGRVSKKEGKISFAALWSAVSLSLASLTERRLSRRCSPGRNK